MSMTHMPEMGPRSTSLNLNYRVLKLSQQRLLSTALRKNIMVNKKLQQWHHVMSNNCFIDWRQKKRKLHEQYSRIKKKMKTTTTTKNIFRFFFFSFSPLPDMDLLLNRKVSFSSIQLYLIWFSLAQLYTPAEVCIATNQKKPLTEEPAVHDVFHFMQHFFLYKSPQHGTSLLY